MATGFITHKGKRIYVIDAEGIGSDGVEALADKAAAEIRAEPMGSVLTITQAKDAHIEMRVMGALRKLAEGNRPYVRAACVTGLSPPQKLVFLTLKVLARRDFTLFDTVEEAKDYLASL